MKRHPTSKSSASTRSGARRDSNPSLIRVDQRDLRDQGDDERVERIWSRLEQQLELTPDTSHNGNSVARLRLSRSIVLAAGVAAGFGLGIAASGLLASPTSAPQSVVMAPSLDRSGGTQVFAAGTAPRSYALPGGGQLQLSPDSIVDTVAQDERGLTLRLVRGSATLAGASTAGLPGQRPAGAAERITLRIGDAQVDSIRGMLRVSLSGDTASVTMLDGSAAVSSPHLDSGHARTLKRNQKTTLPTRAVTASNAQRLSPLAIEDDVAAPLVIARTDDVTPVEEPVAGPAAWREACDSADYVKAVELLNNQASGPQQLTCLATGHMVLKNSPAATAMFQSVIREYPTSPYASTAAHYLSGLYSAAKDTQQAEHYRQMAARLSKGALLSSNALCEKIELVATTDDADKLIALSKRYKNQYPDGPCVNTIDRLLAELEVRQEEARRKEEALRRERGEKDANDSSSPDDAKDHPYDDEAPQDANGAPRDGSGPDRAGREGDKPGAANPNGATPNSPTAPGVDD